MTVSSFSLSDSSVQALFKKKYEKYSENMYNAATKLLSQVKSSDDCVGDEVVRAVPLSFQGGAGIATLPTANRANYEQAKFSTKKLYVVCEVDRRTIKQSQNQGAFVEALKENVKKTVEKYAWLRSFVLFGNGDGAIGTIDGGGVTDNGGGEYALVISSATYQRARVCVRELVNIETNNTDLFEITAHVPSTRTITVKRVSGGQVPVATDVIYLQGASAGTTTPQGLKSVLDATAGTVKYGITCKDGWLSFQKAAGGATISPDLMNECMLGVHENFGKSPNTIVTSYVQMRKLLSQLEDQKRYFSDTKLKSRVGDFSFDAVQFMSIDGPVAIIVDRFCESDRMYFINSDFVEFCNAPGKGWADDEGFVFLRKAGDDQYEARYASYTELYIPPTPHGVVTGLST